MQALPGTRSCFVCGDANPVGLNLQFETDGSAAYTRFTPAAAHIGFAGVIHGGLLSTILDEVMVWGCAVQTKRFAYCAELTVRFLCPAKPFEELLAVGKLVENRRNRLFETTGELRNSANLLVATATGKYLPVPESEMARMLGDFKGDLSAVLNPGDWPARSAARQSPETESSAPIRSSKV